MGGACSTHGKDEKCIQNFLSENLKRRDHEGEPAADRRIILERILKKQGGKSWSGFIWFRIGRSGGNL
jgi:hypothetical protein